MRLYVVLSLTVGAAATMASGAAFADSSVERAPANVPAADARFISKSPAADGRLGMALLAARLNADGTVKSGAGATGGEHLSTGQFVVSFNRDVSGCYYSANSYLDAVIVDLEPRAGDPVSVFLEERDTQGNLVDDAFYLTVFCAQ